MTKLLLLGFGNVDRQDDGIAWHILDHIRNIYQPEKTLDTGEITEIIASHVDILFYPQLAPELADILANYDSICFIDAHTGSYPENIKVVEVEPQYQTSAFTHHMTPGTILALTEFMVNKKIKGILVSVKGWKFEFDHSLSPMANELIGPAVEIIQDWINKMNTPDMDNS